jgi:hypothetical protein
MTGGDSCGKMASFTAALAADDSPIIHMSKVH